MLNNRTRAASGATQKTGRRVSSTHFGSLGVALLSLVGWAGESSGADRSTSTAETKADRATTSGTFERRERIDVNDRDDGFTLTQLNPKTGIILGAHPTKFVVEGQKVFNTINFATGKKGDHCGAITVRDDSVQFEGTCGLASYYPKVKERHFERRESIELTAGGFTQTQRHPETGILLGAHPTRFVVEGTKVFQTVSSASGKKGAQCGTIKISSDAVEFTGTCGLYDYYDKVK